MIKKGTIIFLFNLLILGISLLLYPKFQTNDDIAMVYAYSGYEVFDNPTPFTVFSSKIWGLLMVLLYKSFSSSPFEIYTAIFVLLIFVSFQIIMSRLLRNISIHSFGYWAVLILTGFFIELQFYLELQFTMVAGIVALGGYLQLAGQKNKWDIASGLLLIIIATCIRPSIVPMVICFFTAFYGVGLLLSGIKIKQALKQTIIITFVIVIPLIINQVDKRLLNTNENQFLEFNTFRANIVDFNILEKKEFNSEIAAMGWSNHEIALFYNWFFNDSILYQSGHLNQKIINHNMAGAVTSDNFKLAFIHDFFNQYNYNFTIKCLFIIACIVLVLTSFSKSSLLLFGLYFLIALSLFFIIAVFFKLPPFRMSFLLLSIGVIFLFYFSMDKMNVSTHKLFTVTAILLMLFTGQRMTKNLLYRREYADQRICRDIYSTEKMYIRWPYYPVEGVNPYQITTQKRSKIKIIDMGSFSVHPAVKLQFKNTQFKNLTNDIIGKDSIISFILPNNEADWSNFKSNYIMFIKKHYKRNVYFKKEPISTFCPGYSEFKLIETF
ncbi:MAG: hypothetical protein V4613_10605 [Bacteroidota bacterium]